MKEIILSNTAYKLLLNLVQAPGWAKTIVDIYAGGKFLARYPAETQPDKLEISDKETECIKKAVQFHVQAGTVPTSSFLVEILDAVDLKT